MSLPEAVKVSREAGLTALRDALAVSLVEAPPDKRAPLAAQLREAMRELDSLPNPEAVNPVDDLKAKRAKRRAAAADKPGAKAGVKRRTRRGTDGGNGGPASGPVAEAGS